MVALNGCAQVHMCSGLRNPAQQKAGLAGPALLQQGPVGLAAATFDRHDMAVYDSAVKHSGAIFRSEILCRGILS